MEYLRSQDNLPIDIDGMPIHDADVLWNVFTGEKVRAEIIVPGVRVIGCLRTSALNRVLEYNTPESYTHIEPTIKDRQFVFKLSRDNEEERELLCWVYDLDKPNEFIKSVLRREMELHKEYRQRWCRDYLSAMNDTQ
ncbi:MAG: hypothetical protein K2O14_02960 [Oscillospiraceae bacterium]|nr:hypothetical protein [Oscillospiraceae bacterium]